MLILKIIVLALVIVVPAACQESLLYWGYECRQALCVKVPLNSDNMFTAVSLSACRLNCGGKLGTVWPKPTGTVKISQSLTPIRPKVTFNIPSHPNVKALWEINKKRFRSQLGFKVAEPALLRNEGQTLKIKITVVESADQAATLPTLRYTTDESYSLVITDSNVDVIAQITAHSFFGARHGLETLSQLIVYDGIRNQMFILSQAEITDAPVYKHRGVLLDTGRNYFSTKSLKRTIDAMAMTKLNIFHWHIVDTTSFPLVINSQPDLHMIGAYSPEKIYTHKDITDLIEYARARGVRIYPEIDLPGRAGEGWQIKNTTVCFNIQPWNKYCPLPPCGQLDPTNEDVYTVLEDIYREIFELFDPDIFHMGGTQVILQCWKDSIKISNWMLRQGWSLEEKDYMKLWGYFQARALDKVDKVSNNKQVPIIIWSNKLSIEPYIDQFINNSRYIVQVTTIKGSGEIREALEHGYQIILSNYDALFLDCGFASTIEYGSHWCTPYHGWQTIYENRPEQISGRKYQHLVLGAEAANWGEQIDEYTIDIRFWPRSSALGERMWSNPEESWRDAEARMLMHQARLMENGIQAEVLQPEWCLQNQNSCPKVAL